MTTRNFTVKRYGSDSSGRALFMTVFMHEWWEGVVDRLGFRPTIVQGAFMARAGGGADDSAGYHDKAGALDLRVWDLTSHQVRQVIRELRRSGAAAWLRDQLHGGMDPHIHLVLGDDSPLDEGASWQWTEYVKDNDGLASRGTDYHWRPEPLILRAKMGPEPKTPNITAALQAKSVQAREAALLRVIEKSKNKAARQAARAWLRAIRAKIAAQNEAAEARAALKKQEHK